ncbi:MAG: DUF4199 domain-containing protein [Bacteroidales bacterium]|nr:DUF4199 domain-containing protein [Bacteroidales bacterium]MDD4362472.1 DUF4199 domain-containing protein [Bacteroidales bacterium]
MSKYSSVMEQTPNPLLSKYKYAANYGLYLGLYIALFYLWGILFQQGALSRIITTLGWIGLPFFCVFLVKNYRNKALEGYIRYGQAWSFGLWMFVFASLIMAVVHYLHFELIQPDYIKDNYNQALILLEQMNYPQEQLDTLIKFGVPSSIQFVFSYIWFYIIGGAFLFLILSPFAVRKDLLEN